MRPAERQVNVLLLRSFSCDRSARAGRFPFPAEGWGSTAARPCAAFGVSLWRAYRSIGDSRKEPRPTTGWRGATTPGARAAFLDSARALPPRQL
jgi:hypothetical protein